MPRVNVRFTIEGTGEVLAEHVVDLREYKADNPNEPAAWVIIDEIRQGGCYRTTRHGVVTTLTRAPQTRRRGTGPR